MRLRRRRLKVGLALGAVVACAVVGVALSRATTRPSGVRGPGPRSGLELHVPRAAAPIPIDAETEGKKVWEADEGDTRNFVDQNGQGMVPYTEAKLRWRSGMLYLLLYAGDLDLEGTVTEHDGPVSKDDSFHIEIGGPDDLRVLDVSVLGTVADSRCRASRGCDPTWQSRAMVAVDRDGTLNRIGDNDEEWVVEMSIPLETLGLPAAKAGTRIPFAIRRCEVGHGSPHPCGGWGQNSGSGGARGELVLEP